MTGRRLLRVIFVLLFCASPLLAGESDTSKNLQVAKIITDDNPFQQKRQEVPRKLRINENYSFYDIKGTNVSELKREMRQGGTKWNDGKVYAALTTWDIRYNYDITSEAGKYSIKSVVTDIDVVYHLPNRIAVAAAASGQLSGQWKTYMDRLKEHEFGHKDISVKAATEINEILAGLGSFSSKKELQKEAKRLVEAKLKQLKEL